MPGLFDDIMSEGAPAPSSAPAAKKGGLFDDIMAKPEVGALEAGKLGIQQGITLGFGDELMAGLMVPAEVIKGAITGEDSGKGFDRISDAYGRNLARERGKLEAAREQHPIVTGVSEAAGGMATGGALAKGGVTLMRAGQSLPKMIFAGAGEGAGYGLVSGFGAGEGDAGKRIEDAALGARNGAIIGGAVPLIARGVGMGVSAARGRMAASPAQRLILDDLKAEGLTPAEIAQRARDLGPEGMLADTSETLRLRAEQLAQSDNPARPGVMEALKTRKAGAEGRINSAYDASMGQKPNVYETVKTLAAEKKAHADVFYGQAKKEAGPINVSRVLQAIDDEIMPGAAQVAQPGLPTQFLDDAEKQLMWVRGRLTDGKSVVTDYDRLHNLQSKIGEKASAAKKAGDKYTAGMLGRIRGQLLEAIETAAPSYRQARQTFSSDSAVQDAFQTGREIFSSKHHPDFWAAELADMSQAERDALKVGVRAAVDEAMGRVRNGALKGRTLLDADWNERKVMEALGEEDGQKLLSLLLGEQEMAGTANQVLGNSATSRRMDNPFRRQQKTDDRAGIVRSALNLQFGDAAKRAIEYGADALAGRRMNNLARDVGPMLVAKGSQADRVTNALIDAQSKRIAVEASRPNIERITRAILMGEARAQGPQFR
jgi:hypothetical protein